MKTELGAGGGLVGGDVKPPRVDVIRPPKVKPVKPMRGWELMPGSGGSPGSGVPPPVTGMPEDGASPALPTGVMPMNPGAMQSSSMPQPHVSPPGNGSYLANLNTTVPNVQNNWNMPGSGKSFSPGGFALYDNGVPNRLGAALAALGSG